MFPPITAIGLKCSGSLSIRNLQFALHLPPDRPARPLATLAPDSLCRGMFKSMLLPRQGWTQKEFRR